MTKKIVFVNKNIRLIFFMLCTWLYLLYINFRSHCNLDYQMRWNLLIFPD